jgi:hypothetical protein
LLLIGLTFPSTLPAQAPIREQTSLKFIPDDAAFYGSSLRLKQQFDNFTRSKAFARLCELSFVKQAVDEFKRQWTSQDLATSGLGSVDMTIPARAPTDDAGDIDEDANGDEPDAEMPDADFGDAFRELKAFWSNPENQKLVSVALDALSHEIFFYGDSTIVGFVNELQGINVDLSELMTGGFVGDQDVSPDHPAIKLLLGSLDKLPVPAFVVGFKLSDQAGAKEQLARLETAVQEALKDFAELAKAVRREKVGPGEFLTLKLEGSKIPWDELIDAATTDEKPTDEKLDDDDQDEAQKDDAEPDDDSPDAAANKLTPEQTRALITAVASRLNDRSLTLSLGLYEGYLLFSFGETNEHLLQFSGKGKRLIDRAEFAPLLKSADKPLTGIDYVSAELTGRVQNSSDGVDSLAQLLEKWGPVLGLEDDAQERLVQDVKGLATDAAKMRPAPGAVVRWQYLTPRGYEGYSYDFGGGDKSLDASKKLSILEHVGGYPLIVVAARHKGQLEGYQFLAKSLAVVTPHLDAMLSGHLPDLYAGQYAQLKEEFSPLLERFHAITGEQLLPALADGQSAFVLDGNTFTRSVSELLARPEPLPIPAPALVYGVKDTAQLKQACGGYFALLQEAATALSRLVPEQVPAIDLPPPTEREAPNGMLYVYPIVGEEGDDEIAATGALGTNVAVLSLVPTQAKRFLTKTKFQPTGVLARSEQPAARVWYVSVAGLIDLIQPWIALGSDMSAAFLPTGKPDEADQTLATVLDIVKCWRHSAGIQYRDGGALVEYSESVFEDLK